MKSEKIGFSEKVALLLSGMGNFPMFAIISTFLTYFYTNVIGLNPAAIGMVILVAKVCDGFSDLILGNVVDHTRTSRGVCRPWIIRCAFMLAVTFILLFTVPNTTTSLQLIYVFVTYNVATTIVYTLSTVAVTSLPTYMTRETKQQTILYLLNGIGVGIVNVLVTSVTLNVVNYFGGGQKAWIIVSVMYAVPSCIFLLITGFATKERVNPDEIANTQVKESFWTSLKCVLQNKYWFIVLGIVIFGVGVFACSLQMHTYYAQYILEDMGAVGRLNSAYTMPALIVSILLIPISQKIDRKKIMMFTIIVQLVGCLLIVFASKSVSILVFASVLKGIGYSGVLGLYLPLLSASIEYGHWKTGVRTQAMLMGAKGAGEKIGNGVITAILGGIMGLTGFNGMAAVQTASAINGISMLYLYMPVVLTALEIICLLCYDLDKKYDDIMKDLAEGKTAKDTM